VIFDDASYYLLFLLPTVVVFHRTRGTVRELAIAVAGAAFFVFFSLTYFGGVGAAACLLIFVIELLTSRFYRAGSRWCIWGVAQAILVLVFFKYTNFLLDLVGDVAALWHGPRPSHVRGLFLPLGVSFFTFEFIHYAVDVYKGKYRPAPLSRYAAFILFFPSMVAGPIKRFDAFEPKLEEAQFRSDTFARGVTRILVGLCKKQVLADLFTLWSDRLNGLEIYTAPRLHLLAWVFAYGGKIYFDFSGYSDIAIGSGYLFGIEIPENFDYPYFRTSITEFWRHWHISLYRWIVDYVFIPLGGSRGSAGRVAVNTLLAFLVSGLWHGAGINFALWGLWHGALLVIHRQWGRIRPSCLEGNLAWTLASWLLTFSAVMMGWAFFCMEAPQALFVLGRIAGFR
jgi:alginate O-acetyltransferase complex protein AlgI